MCRGAIAYTEWFPNKLPRFFSREICEGGKTGLSPIVTAARSHLGFYLPKGMGAIAFGVVSTVGSSAIALSL
ncbi:hypothetical protein CENA302_10005 [Cylindrospermopsis raciborskii CENA302]|uniref:Uncharacterized protein n=2 Tax=Cylindrospermopsis raciborskii TaxID=77022 RepID=A0A9Q5QW61_9CYAN|nr:hypothetical protein CENA302_10005 [Cylindrospermopsis raciborskii CENA302]